MQRRVLRSFTGFRSQNSLLAFTLLELLQVMILVAVLMTLVGGTFYYFSTYHLQLTDRLDATSEINQVHRLLQRDAGQYRTFDFENARLVFSTDTDTTAYVFGEPIVRQQGIRLDTFQIRGTTHYTGDGLTVYLASGDIGIRFMLSNHRRLNLDSATDDL